MYKQLTSKQRYTICAMLQRNETLTSIAKTIEVSVSTVSREIRRNSTKKGVYDDDIASHKAQKRKSLTHGGHTIPPGVYIRVLNLIRQHRWSPEQISGRLKREGVLVSKSAIYNYINKIPKGRKNDIRNYMRHGGKSLKKGRKAGKIVIPDRVSIKDRPDSACGNVVGDWEMDTIIGKNGKGVILTLVDRKSLYLIMAKVKTGKKSIPMAYIVVNTLRNSKLPVRTITTDNGLEFAGHKIIAKELNTTVYFAHPYSSWEKGTIENMNGIIRQYIPKGTDFKKITNKQIRSIMEEINNRPRKKNKYETPKEIIQNRNY